MAMMKKEMGMKEGCNCPHHGIFRWVILIVGVLFLFRDLGWWDFWNIQWWTILFLVIGLTSGCKCCGKNWC